MIKWSFPINYPLNTESGNSLYLPAQLILPELNNREKLPIDYIQFNCQLLPSNTEKRDNILETITMMFREIIISVI